MIPIKSGGKKNNFQIEEKSRPSDSLPDIGNRAEGLGPTWQNKANTSWHNRLKSISTAFFFYVRTRADMARP